MKFEDKHPHLVYLFISFIVSMCMGVSMIWFFAMSEQSDPMYVPFAAGFISAATLMMFIGSMSDWRL